MKNYFIFIVAILFLSSCRFLRPDIMLRTPRHYQYSQIKDSTSLKESKLSSNDVIEFRLFSNDGFKLIDLTALTGTTSVLQTNIMQYVIEADGTVKLPVLGHVKIAGLDIREAENFLEEKYTQYYVKPFVLMKVSNKRVIIFPGAGGLAKVQPIINNNTTLIEALALAGGLPEYAKSYKIKVIRGDPQKPIVYLIDLSTITGIAQGSMVVQANDIIYVEPRFRVSSEVLKEISPVLSLLTSAFLVYTVYLTVKH